MYCNVKASPAQKRVMFRFKARLMGMTQTRSQNCPFRQKELLLGYEMDSGKLKTDTKNVIKRFVSGAFFKKKLMILVLILDY